MGTDFDLDGGLIARCVTAGEGKRQDYETCTMVAQPINFGAQMSVPQVDFNLCQTLQAKNPMAVAVTGDVFHTLRAEGFDASEDGTGRGTPLVPVGVTIHGTDPTVQKVASYDELAQCLRARTPGNIDNSSTTVVQQPVVYAIQAGALRASTGGGDKPHVSCEAVYNQGFNHESNYASTQETHAGKILRTLREAVGEEAFAQWGLGILGSLQPPEILRQALHGLSVRPAAFSRSWVVHCALSRSENRSVWLLQSLREAGCERCASQGWQPPEQLARELGAYLSELSQPGAQASRFVRDLWWAAQGSGVLRQALSAVQKVGRPAGHQGQPVRASSTGGPAASAEDLQGAGLHGQVSREGVLQQACPASSQRDAGATTTDQERSGFGAMAVRRLIVEECEFLQGFPRGYTAIPWRGKPADQCPDGPRYRALGNSWAVPVVAWIGRRIAAEVAP